MSKNERYATLRRLHQSSGELNYALEVFGDHLAKKHGYKAHDTLDAVRYHLMLKFHWTPSQVRSMSLDDLHFALAEEMHGWQLPKDAR